jgi:glucose/arabinose dehydrogenase
VLQLHPVGLGGFLSGDSGSTDGQQAIYTRLRAPQGIAVATGGVLYVLDQGNNRVLRLAGGRAQRGAGVYNGDAGAALSTQLMNPRGVAFGLDGSLYVADSDRSVVRRVSPDGASVSGVAGNGTRGDAGHGGRAAQALLA